MFKTFLSAAILVSLSISCSKNNDSALKTELSDAEIKETHWVSAGLSSSAFKKFCFRSFEPTPAIAKTISVMVERFSGCSEADENYSQRTTIDLSDKGEIDVTPVASYTNMEKLIVNNAIGKSAYSVDFTVLWSLGEEGTLKSIEAIGRNITDASSLARIPSLVSLNLMNNNVKDLKPLMTLPNLEGLILKRNGITDISALVPMPKLRNLSLHSNPIKDFSPLSKLTVRYLGLSDVGASDVSNLASILAKMPNLGSVDLSKNGIVDVSALAKLTNVTSLDLSQNAIVDPRPLADLNLSSLTLFGNPINKEFCPTDSKNPALNSFCKTL